MSYQYYVTIKGSKQGQFKGESTPRGESWVVVRAFELGSEVPVDVAQGHTSGKRQHSPVIITKEIDAASPQLLDAHWNGEVLDEVVIDILDDKGGGNGRRITLNNVVLQRFRRLVESSGRGRPNTVLEEYGLRYQRIRWQRA